MTNLFNFKEFNNEEEFIEFQQLLKSHNVEFETKISGSSIEAVTMRPHGKVFNVFIEKKDIGKVEDLINEIVIESIKDVDKSHYLFEFSDKELIEIIENPDDWSPFDYQLSKKILNDRGIKIDEDFLNSIELKRIEKQYKTEESSSIWITIGFISSFLGGFIGIIIGSMILLSKKTLPNGDSILTYSASDRKKALWMIYLGLAVIIFIFYLKFRGVQ